MQKVDFRFNKIFTRNIKRIENDDRYSFGLSVEAGSDRFGGTTQDACKLIGCNQVVVPGKLIGKRGCGSGGGIVKMSS